MRQPFSGTFERALIQVEPVIDFFTQSPWRTPEHLPELKNRQASARKALEILSTGKARAYDAALVELDGSTRKSWEQRIAPEPEDLDEDEDPDGDEEPYTADATALAQYLKDSVLPQLAKHVGYLENRHLIREQGTRSPGCRAWQTSSSTCFPPASHGPRLSRASSACTRSLTRHLTQEGTPFGEILERLRRRLASRYLADDRMSVQQIAKLLGYSEPGAFTHAYKRWTGTTPRRARKPPPGPR